MHISAEDRLVKSGIYKIEHVASGKCYIGSSANIPERLRQHLSLLRMGKHHSPKLQHSFSKYGEEAFRLVVVEQVSIEDLIPREQAWMDETAPFFNIAPKAGTRRGMTLSEETRKKMSEARKGKSPSAETREKMSAWQRGRKRPEETCRKMSESKKAAGLKGRPAHNKGVKHSPETRAKLSAAHKGKPTWFGATMDAATVERLQAAKRAAAERRAKQ